MGQGRHSDAGMLRGQPTGAAMPLVWAHAEYIKLLRSAVDGRVFDRLESGGRGMRGRAGGGAVRGVAKDRQVRRMEAGRRLRVESEESFDLIWSADDWKTTERREPAVGFADFSPMLRPPRGSAGFTLFWPAGDTGRAGITEVLLER